MNKLKNNFKFNGFTFAELMVSLVIIAVITALLYPTISELAPNNNKHLFKSAYRTVEMIVSEIVNASDTGTLPTSTTELCSKFESKLNTVSFTVKVDNVDSSGGCNSNPPQLRTSNGMRWAFTNYSDADKSFTLYIDVNASNNGNSISNQNCPDAVSSTWGNGCISPESDIARDTFKLIIKTNGRIIVDDSIGVKHLQETSE